MNEQMMEEPESTQWEGDYIVVRQRGSWEYVGRPRGIRAAVILAVDEGEILLVEQFRVPLGKPCLELPAGLVGDEDSGDEDVLEAAARELEEETGYRAEEMESLGEFFSSPGMMSESFTLVRAHGLTQIGEGGGVGSEDITVHRVPLGRVEDFVAAARARGVAIDVRVMSLLMADWID